MRFTILKTFFLLIFILSIVVIDSHAQPMPFNQQTVDSISNRLPLAKDDTSKIKGLVMLAQMYLSNSDWQTVLNYAEEANAISKRIEYKGGRIESLAQMIYVHASTEDWPRSIMEINEAIPLCKEYPRKLIYFYSMMFVNYALKGDMEEAKSWALKAVGEPFFQSSDEIFKWATYMQLGRVYEWEGKIDSAQYYADITKSYAGKYHHPDLLDNTYYLLGTLARKQKHYDEAIQYYRRGGLQCILGLTMAYDDQNNIDSSIYYAKVVLDSARKVNSHWMILESAKVLAYRYTAIDPNISIKYLNLYIETQDDRLNVNKLKALEEIKLSEQKAQFNLEKQEADFNNTITQLSLLGISIIFLSAALFFLRSNRIKQTANKKLQEAYSALEATQAQLIHSEKMASLGELTAGIAHEIQNPLNFVNNFSEVNKELLSELKEEIEKGNFEEAKSLAGNVIDNQEKINHHGKRADAIVKGMLQHSRNSSGVRELTDINALVDEYSRLAYHGFRAKDKSFNATLKKNFEDGIGLINVVPQDIGRVVFNLISNAFDALSTKALTTTDGQYEKTVSLSTKKINSRTDDPIGRDKVEIRVKDNGNGIPPKVLDKIFQPFFTTKPTGQGTGLGLSLSYDIVKAHGGELSVKTTEGEGSEFIVTIPIV